MNEFWETASLVAAWVLGFFVALVGTTLLVMGADAFRRLGDLGAKESEVALKFVAGVAFLYGAWWLVK